ncbi:Hypothetical predicted protein [Mytilus galloprovincialis]|uniref:Uncharacterized protein n=1 Tax=Mytilus galloprovincialis TaxID=29158 RepID=A0A8B6FEA7_MYTGA|nr:Hypothetical predicted protein [Mytilus galloprovincialis]
MKLALMTNSDMVSIAFVHCRISLTLLVSLEKSSYHTTIVSHCHYKTSVIYKVQLV